MTNARHRLAHTHLPTALHCLWMVALPLMGCTSDEQHCQAAQAEAGHAWGRYAEALEARKQAALTAQGESKRAMLKISPGISAIAGEETSKLYDRGPSWQRHYLVAFDQVCARTPECAVVHKRLREAEKTLASIDAWIDAARTAQRQTAADPAAAWTAAQAIDIDAADPMVTEAHRVSRAAAEQCKLSMD